MSDLPPIDENNEPTREGESTQPEPFGGSELPRRGYDSERRMKPPPRRNNPSPQAQQQKTPPPTSSPQQPRYNAPPPSASRAPRRPSPANTKADSGLYLPWWSLLILVAVVGGGACFLLYGVSQLADNLVIGDQTPQVIVVTSEGAGNASGNVNNAPPGSVPTSFPVQDTAIPQAQATATSRPARATGCPVGILVAVNGTGEVGLSIRNEPAQGNNIQYVASEGEQFRIIGGPQNSVDANGNSIEWCELEGELVASVSGWAAVDFLLVIDE